MGFWNRFFGPPGAARTAPRATVRTHGLMTTDKLFAEGRRLQRECVFLKDHGTGEPAGVWHRDAPSTGDHEPWLTVDARFVPGFEASAARFLTISTSNDDATGRVDFVDRLPEGLPLYAHRVDVPPPVEAIFAPGNDRVAAWMKAIDCDADSRYWDGFPDADIIEPYHRQWADQYPILCSEPGLVAALGGWHMPFPDDDWLDLVHERLLVLTVRDSEPWVEAWQASDGRLHVIQRVT